MWPWFKNKKEEHINIEPRIGEIWSYTLTRNPWIKDVLQVRVKDVKSGWVCYSFDLNNTEDISAEYYRFREIADFVEIYSDGPVKNNG